MASFLTIILLAHTATILVLVAMPRAVVTSSLRIISTGPLGQLPIAINSDQVISFNCTVAGGEAAWEIGGHQFLKRDEYRNNGVVINISDDLLSTTLSISKEGLDTLNQTNSSIRIIKLRCFVFNLKVFENMFGRFSYIIRHGAPGSPRGLHLISSSSLGISWKRPSNIPSVVPIQYTVEIRDLITGDLFQQNSTTELYMAIIHVSVQTKCDPYSMTVMAWNEAGHSTAASITESIPLDPDTSSISQSLEVKELDFHNGQYISFQVSFQPALGCNSKFPVLNHTVVLDGPGGGMVPLIHENFNSSSSSFNTTIRSSHLHGLTTNAVYLVYITACSSFTCKRSQSVKLRTFDIQFGSVVFKDTYGYLSCVPTDGSTIYGCKFAFPLPNKTDYTIINITQDNEEVCYQLHNQRDAYTNISVSPVDQDGRVVGVSLTAHVTEDESRPGCSSTTAPNSGDDNTDSFDDGTLAGIVVVVVVLVLVVVSGLGLFILSILFPHKAQRFLHCKQDIEETDGEFPKVDVSLSRDLVEALKAAATKGKENLKYLENRGNMKDLQVLLRVVP